VKITPAWIQATFPDYESNAALEEKDKKLAGWLEEL
jgi:hypothetical protein